MQPTLVHRSGSVATIILNRPQRLNAMDLSAWQCLAEAVRELDCDRSCTILVLKGAGHRAFCSGHDFASFDSERGTRDQVRHFSETVSDATAALASFHGVTIAAIHGYCMGAGLQIALECDMRIAERDVQFAITPKKAGLFLEYELMDVLLAAVGRARTLELVLEGSTVDAGQAHRIGLVTHLVESGELHRRVDDLAQSIVAAWPAEDGGRTPAGMRARAKRIRR